MPYGLTEKQLQEILAILTGNGKIRKVILYGSRAKGNFSPGSDIDPALMGDDLELNDIVDFEVKLDRLPMLNKVDLVICDKITEPALIEHIERVGIVVCQAEY